MVSDSSGIRVLVVDDQHGVRRSLALLLQKSGIQTGEADSGAEALLRLEEGDYDLVVTDLRMDDMSGNDLLREIRLQNYQVPVIMITAYGSIESAVESMRLGAFDYVTKPFQEQEILDKIRGACALKEKLPGNWTADAKPGRIGDLVAESSEMTATMIRAERIAGTDLTVLISGETGTGKTRFAKLIHDKSARAGRPFVSVNCASLPEQLLESELFGHVKGSFTGATQSRVGLFEAADRGTIFLDEIDTLTPRMQAKLLSVLHDNQIRPIGGNRPRTVDVRVISATNQEIRRLLQDGTFREDLYYRINGVRLHLPPLRERPDDLHTLVDRLLAQYSRKYGRSRVQLSSEAQERVLGYSYPGNIRQLESLIEQIVVFAPQGDEVRVDTLPEELLETDYWRTATVSGTVNIADSERAAIEAALQRFDNLNDAAKELGIGRTTLWRKIRQYDIQRSRNPSK